MQQVHFKDLGQMDYKTAWDYQEQLLRANTEIKALIRSGGMVDSIGSVGDSVESRVDSPSDTQHQTRDPLLGTHDSGLVTHDSFLAFDDSPVTTKHHLLFVEHPPVYTLGKSGKIEHVLISDEERFTRGIDFFYTNRGGDITFHGPQQLVGYPILDLEKFYTDIGRYLRNLEEVTIETLADYGIKGERSAGETGVWIEPGIAGKERKICAIGVRCSRWVTMHGFAFNVNTDLSYFDNIIPCGIQNKRVTSLANELGRSIDFNEVKENVKKNFEKVFNVQLTT